MQSLQIQAQQDSDSSVFESNAVSGGVVRTQNDVWV